MRKDHNTESIFKTSGLVSTRQIVDVTASDVFTESNSSSAVPELLIYIPIKEKSERHSSKTK